MNALVTDFLHSAQLSALIGGAMAFVRALLAPQMERNLPISFARKASIVIGSIFLSVVVCFLAEHHVQFAKFSLALGAIMGFFAQDFAMVAARKGYTAIAATADKIIATKFTPPPNQPKRTTSNDRHRN